MEKKGERLGFILLGGGTQGALVTNVTSIGKKPKVTTRTIT